MNNYRNIVLFVLIALLGVPFSSLSSQEIDMQEVRQLQDNLEEVDKNSPNLPNDEFKDEEEIELREIREDRLKELLLDIPSRDRPKDFITLSQPKVITEPLTKFGYDLFIDSPTTFAPATEIPIPSDYIIGPGDNLKIILFGKQADELTLQVTRSGQIFFPEIGPIYLAGLTFSRAEELVSKRVANQMIGVQVDITLGALRSIQVFILGEVYQPGTYTVSSLSSLTNAIFSSGGIRTSGSLRNIQLKRNGEIITTYDFYDLLLRGDISKDIRIEPGDVIFVPAVGKTVGIAGEVNRPAIYELKDPETINDLIFYSGGLLPNAQSSSAELESISATEDSYLLKNINLNLNEENSLLNNGDTLYIYPVLNTINNAVLVSGYAQRPGFYAWNDSLKLSDILGSSEKSLPMTDQSYVLIKREGERRGDFISYQVDTLELSDLTDSKTNISLKNRDEIFLFSKINDQDQDQDQDQESTNQNDNNLPDIDVQNELLIMKNGSVQVIDQENWSFYKSEGFEQVEKMSDSETDEMQKLIQIRSGNRQVLLSDYIELLKQESNYESLPKIVRVEGNVFFPGEYPLTVDMDFEDAIKAAGGFKDKSFMAEVEISRRFKVEKEYETTRFTKSVNDLTQQNELLTAGDVITVKRMETETRMVEITGEVFFPGEYLLTSDDTLSELIIRAGGLKDEAFLDGAVFERESLKKSAVENLRKSQEVLRRDLIQAQSNTGGVGESDGQTGLGSLFSLIEDIDEDSIVGRLVVDLPSIISDNNQDLLLENGDTLFIPKIQQSVSVIGEVYVPTSHLFSESMSTQDYLKLSGGVKETGDVSSLYVIKANGSIMPDDRSGGFFKSNTNLRPGDTIVVPADIRTFSSLKAATDITQVIYQMALATAAINSF